MMNIKLKKEEHSPDLLKGKHFLRFILYFSYELKKKNLPHFQKFLPLIFEIFYKIFGGATTHSKYPSSLEKVF